MGKEATSRVLLFPGQGAQFVGMGQEFHASSEAARRVFERADAALGMELARHCFEGPEQSLAATDICQPAILTCSVAILATLEERGLLDRGQFRATAGLSLGEYTALWFAGVLSFEDALRLVRIRGQGMQRASEAEPSGMCSLLGATEEKARALCDAAADGEVLVLANLLAPGNLVISGHLSALERASARAKEFGIRRVVPLKVAGAFHSPLMQPAVEALESAFTQIEFSPPSLPVYSNVTAQPHGDVPQLRADLSRQVTSSVRWEDTMRAMLATGPSSFLEPGPGSVLTGLLRKVDKAAVASNVGTLSDLETFASAKTGAKEEKA